MIQLTHSFPIHPFSTLWKHQKTGVKDAAIKLNETEKQTLVFSYEFY